MPTRRCTGPSTAIARPRRVMVMESPDWLDLVQARQTPGLELGGAQDPFLHTA